MKTIRMMTRALLMCTLALPLAVGSVQAVVAAPAAPAAAPAKQAMTADAILKKAGDTLFPENFSARLEITQYKPNATTPPNVQEMLLYKRGQNLVRGDYTKPAVQAGQKILRKDDQIWLYMPDTHKPVKLSPKQSLGGSDFNNGDLMRLDFVADYNAAILSEDANNWVLDLTAKNKSVAYSKIKYTIEKKTFKSVKQEFYSLSGKLEKTLEFSEFKDYGGLTRPSMFVMKSAQVQGLYTTMKYLQFDPGKTLNADQFRVDTLSR